MKADPFQIGDVLKDPKRFIVPIYQRTYSWKKGHQLERFFDTVEEKATERLQGTRSAFPHYMGAILLSPRGTFTFGSIPVFDVVDGQQRLTTYQIFLAAVRDLALEVGADAVAHQLGTFLINASSPLMKDERVERYKLQATTYDRELIRHLVDLRYDDLRDRYPEAFYKNGNAKENAPLPLAAWWYFRKAAQAFIADGVVADSHAHLGALAGALLEDFRVIVITLDDTDDAQVIFETLNSGGEPLAAMDLVRNDVFHRAIRANEDPEDLMARRWQTFEEPFWKSSATQGRIKKPRIDFFLAHTLAAETGKETLLNELFVKYKSFVASSAFPSVDEELKALVRHAPTYRALVRPEDRGPLGELARQLDVFDVSTAFPLVFVIADRAESTGVAQSLYRLISSYVIRRALCGLTPKAYNNTFLRVAGHLKANGVTKEEFAAAFADSSGDAVRFPSDRELREAIQNRAQYKVIPTPRLAYILGELERVARTKFDETDGLRPDLTIEHVLPDKWAEHWPLLDGTKAPKDFMVAADDPRYAAIRQREVLKHSLGNLSLLTPSGNPRLSNLPFTAVDPDVGLTKREAFRTSLLRMNQEIGAREKWDEDEIRGRAASLAGRAIGLWPSP